MRIVAALSWYDEPPEALAGSVRSLRTVADHLVAIDGAYAAFPGAEEKPYSPPEQYQAISSAWLASDRDNLFFESRGEPWEGEVEKRARLMEYAAELAGEDGWVFVIDGDELVHRANPGWRDMLAETDRPVAEVEFREGLEVVKARRFFRALPGLTVEGMHYRYVVGGRVLWGNPNEHQEPPADLSVPFSMVHFPRRTDARQERRRAYYRKRAALNLESPPCRCGEPAYVYVAADLKAAGRDKIDAGWRPVCRSCEAAAVAEVVAQGRSLRLGRDALMMLARRRGNI